MEASKNVPSLAEAERVVRFVLSDELAQVPAKVAGGAPSADALRECLAITIAVVGATEQLYQAAGKTNPSQWEALEQSAHAFVDQFALDLLAGGDPALKLAVTRQRRRKLAARAGALCLVETDHAQQHRWSEIVMPDDAPVPIAAAVGEHLADSLDAAEDRLFEHLVAINADKPLALAGQIVGLLAASECLLALLPSNEVAAFCVRLASIGAAHQQS